MIPKKTKIYKSGILYFIMQDIDETYPITIIHPDNIPEALLEIPEPPKELRVRGTLPDETFVFLTVVGSRRYSNYGEQVCRTLIAGLSGYPVVVVSGLAMGIDTLAHQTAIENNITTIAFPGSGLHWKNLYPGINRNLAEKILQSGGALVSELKDDQPGAIWTFPRRNRLMAGIAKATLVIESTDKSGTLITARLALDYNRDLLTVPAAIFNETAKGTNGLLRQGATPITCVKDLLEALGLGEMEQDETKTAELANCNPEEKQILILLSNGPMSRDDLIRVVNIPTSEINSLLSIMEIKGLIIEKLGEIWRN